MFFADALFADELEDMSVTVGDHVTFTCTAISFRFQPELYWILDNERYTDCLNGAEYCIDNNVLGKQRTRSTSTFTTFNITKHSVTCVVSQRPNVTSTAILTVLAKGDTVCNYGINRYIIIWYYPIQLRLGLFVSL